MLPALGSLPAKMLTPVSFLIDSIPQPACDMLRVSAYAGIAESHDSYYSWPLTRAIKLLSHPQQQEDKASRSGQQVMSLGHGWEERGWGERRQGRVGRGPSQCRVVTKSPFEPNARMPAHSSCSSPLSAPCCSWQLHPTASCHLPTVGTTTRRTLHIRTPQPPMEDSLAPEETQKHLLSCGCCCYCT